MEIGPSIIPRWETRDLNTTFTKDSFLVNPLHQGSSVWGKRISLLKRFPPDSRKTISLLHSSLAQRAGKATAQLGKQSHSHSYREVLCYKTLLNLCKNALLE